MITRRSFLIASILSLTLGQETDVINLGGIYDTTAYHWAPDIFEVTVDIINREWRKANPINHPRLVYSLENSDCSETTAARSYWKIRTENGGKPPHGIVGARCSGATTTLARISGLEGVPHITPASNSDRLSNDEEFPFFSRMMAPNDERGEVGATIAMLREFGWSKITVLNTDTKFARDWATAFTEAWVKGGGTVPYGRTIRLTHDGSIETDAIRRVLEGVPIHDPKDNSRIVLLAAHFEHAFRILEEASSHPNIKRDTVFVGGSSWAPEYENQKDLFWIRNAVPGYLAAVPFRNQDSYYNTFLEELQAFQSARGKSVTEELPQFAQETVDSIRAMATALAKVPDRTDGAAVVRELRRLEFNGVSGPVSFNEIGDRKAPRYSLFNAQSVTEEGTLVWKEIGTMDIKDKSVAITSDVCLATYGCGPVEGLPSDSYPTPSVPVPIWTVVVIVIIALLLVLYYFKYKRKKGQKRLVFSENQFLRQSVAGLRTAECTYIPKVRKAGDVEQALDDTAQWAWQEFPEAMAQHEDNPLVHDFGGCWMLYNYDCSAKLEKAFKQGKSKVSPMPGYVVSFESMEQKNIKTGFRRSVQRVIRDDSTTAFSDTGIEVGSALPADLEGQPLVVLVKGDVLQVSKQQRTDDWVFGTKLRYAKESSARELVEIASQGLDSDSANVFPDSGWFELGKTRVPTAEDLKFLEDNIADGALACPETWETVRDPSIVEKHVLSPGKERFDVEEAFLSTLNRIRTRVIKVERIQNEAMWQSYVVKRQTLCNREISLNGGDASDDALQKAALDRYEKKWLFHGTNVEVMANILQQGFNRSFCGKHATKYGRGVYYARDASYSACTTYSVPDRNGFQYVMACRVVVGEYCLGQEDAPVPDVRDSNSRTLYDTTVDDKHDPSVFVTYHDAQAYPEYLITFKELPRADCY